MTRRPPSDSREPTDAIEMHVPPEFRARLETARLEVLSLLRALDSLHLAGKLPDELQAIFELDADFAEALAVLDHPTRGYNLPSMVRDTLASLDQLPLARKGLLDTLPPADRERLTRRIPVVNATLDPSAAYNQIPGRDPRAG